MALEHYFEGEHESCLENRYFQSDAASVTSSDDNHSGGFDCNICLESVQDPVVTLCGHLFCWPCIYEWLHFQNASAENQQLQCPVCKAQVSQATLVPDPKTESPESQILESWHRHTKKTSRTCLAKVTE